MLFSAIPKQFIMVIVFILVLTVLAFAQYSDPYSIHSPHSDMFFGSNEQSQFSMDLPLIVWWTSDLYPHSGEQNDDGLARIECDQFYCLSSSNKTYLSDPRTRGIMFYGSLVEPHKLPLPRRKTHEWYLYHEESPLNNYLFSQEVFIKLFNHTATFRRESDYPLTTQNIYGLNFLTDRKPLSVAEKNKLKVARNLASVLYVQSHGNVASYRDRYVKELMKYIKVDSYGTQLHNKDLPENLRNPEESFERKDFLDFISVYKFHLAFENAICKDYMTEKLMRPIHVGSVPIYYGSPDAKDWMPNNSTVIMVNDFKSPKALADFINYLDNNDEEYEKYLAYKIPGGVTNNMLINHIKERPWGSYDIHFHTYNVEKKPDSISGFECYACKEISKRLQREKDHLKDSSVPLLPPKMANNSHMGCPEPSFPITGQDSSPSLQEFEGVNWIRVYRQGQRIAEMVNKMLLENETDSGKLHDYMENVRTGYHVLN